MARRPEGSGSTTKTAAAPAKKPAVPRPAKADPAPAAQPAPEPVVRPVPSGKLFSVTRSRGPAWNPALPQEGQTDWTGHAAFMNALESDGFVVVGGPLDDTPYTLLAVRAPDAAAVRERLMQDPWEITGVLETTRIVGWNLALGQDKI
jgi:uncharacterized protein YciI